MSTQVMTSRNTDDLYNHIKSLIDVKTITIGNIISIITLSMEAVEKMKTSTGEQKKEMVLHTVLRITDEIADYTHQTAVKHVVEFLAPTIIDHLISATKGKFNINGSADTQSSICCWKW